MSWADLLSTTETVTVPWTGGRAIAHGGRRFRLKGQLPREHGWHIFEIGGGRNATWKEEGQADLAYDQKRPSFRGYLVENRVILDGSQVSTDPTRIAEQTEEAFLIPQGLGRFLRVLVARDESGRLIFVRQEFPIGPEPQVQAAFLDKLESVTNIPNVTPALDLAFRLESWARAEAERLRVEAEARRAAAEAARLAELAEAERQRVLAERRAELLQLVGTADGRRELAQVDFRAAAEAALAVTNSELLDITDQAYNEAIIQFRYRGRRFECVVSKQDLGIIDSGICLTDERTGVNYDRHFTLESLPTVIGEAIDTHRLVVYRRVDTPHNYYRER